MKAVAGPGLKVRAPSVAAIVTAMWHPFWPIAVGVVTLGLLAVWAERGLYLDGAHYLMVMLVSQDLHHIDPARSYGEILMQVPILAAMKLGVRDIEDLILIQSLSLYFFPIIIWLIALYKVRHERMLFWPFVFMFAVVHFNVNLMAIGNFALVYAMVACILAVTLRRDEISIYDGWLLIALSLVLLRSYETVIFLLPLVGFVTVVRFIEACKKNRHHVAVLLAIAIMLFAQATFIAVWSILHPFRPANQADARDLDSLLGNKQLFFSVILACFYCAFLWFGRWRPAWLVFGLAATVSLLALARFSNLQTPWEYWSARAYASLLMAGLIVMLIVVKAIGIRWPILPTHLSLTMAAIPLTTVLFFAAVDVHHSRGYHDFVTCFRAEVNSSTGLIPHAQSGLLKDKACRDYYQSGWANPTMSILFWQGTSGAIVLNYPSHPWQPFDPAKPEQLPDLSRYHH